MQAKTFGKLNIIVAVYGLKTITEQIKSLVIDGKIQTLNFKVNNEVIEEDGWRGQRKSITILYNYDGGDLQVEAAKEGDILVINPDKIKVQRSINEDVTKGKSKLTIMAASYGPHDVTDKIRDLIACNSLSFTTDNAVLGDTWNGVAKTLVLVPGFGDQVKGVKVFAEREFCDINLNETVTIGQE
ncbi:hypothetical protein BH10BAC2_BH10BAC2_16670 [soil metagenome]